MYCIQDIIMELNYAFVAQVVVVVVAVAAAAAAVVVVVVVVIVVVAAVSLFFNNVQSNIPKYCIISYTREWK